jgi:hypothetical protein
MIEVVEPEEEVGDILIFRFLDSKMEHKHSAQND